MRKTALFLLSLFVFTIPWEDMVSISGFGTLSRIVGILAFSLTVLLVIKTGRLRIPHSSHVWMTIFVTLAAMSYAWTVDPDLTTSQIFTYMQLLAMVWVIWEIPRVSADHLKLMSSFVLGAYVASLGTITTYFFGPATDSGRYVAVGFDPNALGVILAIGIPIAWYLASASGPRLSWVYRMYLPVSLLSILLTASRGAFVAAAVAILIVPLISTTRSGGKRAPIFVVGLVVAVALVASLAPQASWDRLLTSGQELTSGTLNSRTLIWQAGFRNFNQSPILGVGSGAFKSSLGVQFSREYVVHNVFLSVLFEQGILGLAVFAALLLSLIRCTRKLPNLQQRLWFLVMLVWSIGGLTLTMEPRKITWLIWGLVVAQSMNTGKPSIESPLGIPRNVVAPES